MWKIRHFIPTWISSNFEFGQFLKNWSVLVHFFPLINFLKARDLIAVFDVDRSYDKRPRAPWVSRATCRRSYYLYFAAFCVHSVNYSWSRVVGLGRWSQSRGCGLAARGLLGWRLVCPNWGASVPTTRPARTILARCIFFKTHFDNVQEKWQTKIEKNHTLWIKLVERSYECNDILRHEWSISQFCWIRVNGELLLWNASYWISFLHFKRAEWSRLAWWI